MLYPRFLGSERVLASRRSEARLGPFARSHVQVATVRQHRDQAGALLAAHRALRSGLSAHAREPLVAQVPARDGGRRSVGAMLPARSEKLDPMLQARARVCGRWGEHAFTTCAVVLPNCQELQRTCRLLSRPARRAAKRVHRRRATASLGLDPSPPPAYCLWSSWAPCPLCAGLGPCCSRPPA